MEINERQMALYQYLTRKMANTDYVSKHLLMMDLDGWYNRSKENCSINNSSAYRTLRKDIEAINKSSAQYVILSHKEKGKLVGYKLATKNEEIAMQAERLQRQALRLLVKARELNKKAKNNGQVRFKGDYTTTEIESTINYGRN